MSFESRLHDDLHRASLPHTLVPPPGLADTVLAGNRRRAHRTVALAAGGAVAAGLTIVGATTLVPGPGSPPGGTALIAVLTSLQPPAAVVAVLRVHNGRFPAARWRPAWSTCSARNALTVVAAICSTRPTGPTTSCRGR